MWLPSLLTTFPPGPGFALHRNDGAPLGDQHALTWQRGQYDVEIGVDPAHFTSDAHRQVLAVGGEVIRIEIPAHEADFVAYSIFDTDLAATLLEQVVGLQYGVIAVNRQPRAVRFNAVPPVRFGEALILDRRDPLLREAATQVG
jgi:hypothetical protein